jgi:glucose-6-phosphate 1-dehydrogenase
MKTNDQLEPAVFVIFGGAGDLTWRKLVPALFDLSQDRSMPADFSVIAVDRVDLSDEKPGFPLCQSASMWTTRCRIMIA